MDKRVFIVKIEDWQAIYIDGECIEQHHIPYYKIAIFTFLYFSTCIHIF